VNAEVDIRPDARARLAEATRAVHEALHRDPVLSVLTRPGLEQGAYLRALSAFRIFFGTVEAARRAQDAFPTFSLAHECLALQRDLSAAQERATLDLSGHVELLGALYVAHGSAFGKGTFRAHVTSAFPEVPHHFVTRRAAPSIWRDLVAHLNAVAAQPGALEQLQTGANKAFGLMQTVCADAAPDTDQEDCD